jgi:hypothetical protein
MVKRSLSQRDIETLAAVTDVTVEALSADLRRRPWAIHDLLEQPDVLDAVLDRHVHPAQLVSPFLLFSVLTHAAAAELREATYVSDWAGSRIRLPVFDIEPIHEFLEDAGRLLFLGALLASYVSPRPAPVPADPMDLSDLALWLEQVTPADRITLLRQLGDLALFRSGVFPDQIAYEVMPAATAERLGTSAHLAPDEIQSLCDKGTIGPGIEALETLGSRWYAAAAREDEHTPAIVVDMSQRFRSARRVLNHLSDRWLYDLEPAWGNVA